jgi:adenine-specific DNA-methyltransferase
MPTLDFKGKSFIYTHHLGVPYRELLVVPEKSSPVPGRQPDLDDNLILHGDNLEALKALLPRYAGKVDCIYIDPPYNTGTEGWCYNDAVNAPLMREWLKKAANPVERDDLQRHDKWLCMMWPRLQLLKELLAEDGAIFVSIDDNEVHRLRAVMDEVFGEENYVATIEWQKRYTRSNNTDGFTTMTEHIVIYAKSPGFAPNLSERDEEADARYENPDNDPRGPWKAIPFTNPLSPEERPGLVYPIIQPNTGETLMPMKKAWRSSKSVFDRHVKDERVWWGANGKSRQPNIKKFLNEVSEGMTPISFWDIHFAGSTDDANAELQRLFGDKVFPTPKPSSLIRRVVEVSAHRNALILDCFAGSGTTAHAVLDLNKKDGGNRRFILVQMKEEFRPEEPGYKLGFREVVEVTAERVRRVILGYDYQGTVETELHPPQKVTWTTFKKAQEVLDRIKGIENLERANYDKIEKKIEDGVLTVVGKKTVTERMPGLGGSFTYVELGESMDLDRLLAETPGTLPGFASLARYLFHTATGHTLATAADALVPGDAPVLIGETAVWRIYLHYRPDEAWLRSPAAAFTRTHAEAIAAVCEKEANSKQVLVFAAAKYISHKSLRELRVDFAQLPYALHRVQAE